mmetsp:Transcript_51577/g.81892  ORF Transcript_51577/g.81892 Transcript_51577/m.81892 type:complete len:127 (+) Transcript_51577:73-453(+)|eukprot:CAMPEP_0169126198 /NCGR_PEP_ID=MMETSP1015-20121227/35315_1 /TAXON_ID=342587 /ORGANISM="Karlodinium micrum, Strain CCMP2283" /LENGTH=126 /DNA_ID=CAMNT_0009189835 /DNA_START=72 /DNA_END=452 /DNA_ORIENTATION=-
MRWFRIFFVFACAFTPRLFAEEISEEDAHLEEKSRHEDLDMTVDEMSSNKEHHVHDLDDGDDEVDEAELEAHEKHVMEDESDDEELDENEEAEFKEDMVDMDGEMEDEGLDAKLPHRALRGASSQL